MKLITNDISEAQRAADHLDAVRKGLESKIKIKVNNEIIRVGRLAASIYRSNGILSTDTLYQEHYINLLKIIKQNYEETIDKIITIMQGSVTKNFDGEIERFIQEWVGVHSLSRVQLMVNTTLRENLQSIINQAVSEGLGQQETAVLIDNTFRNSLGPVRSARIARTETHAVANAANLKSVEAMGVQDSLKKRWTPISDARTRDTHLMMLKKEPIAINDYFNVAGSMMMHPGDPNGPASEVVNCRCVLTYVQI